MSIFKRHTRAGTVLLAPDGKRVNMVKVEFEPINRYARQLLKEVEWIDPKVFPIVPKVGDTVRFIIEPTIVGTEVTPK